MRAIERNDLAQLLDWRNRTEYRRYFRECKERNFDQQLAWFENTVLNDPNTIMFAITDLASGRLLGACGLCYINWIHRNADFSIYIGADDLYIDDRFAVDAGKVLCNYAFAEMGIHRLWSEIYDFDEPKKQLFNTLGFKLDGCHRQTYWYDASWHNSLFYSILSHEFETEVGTHDYEKHSEHRKRSIHSHSAEPV